MNYLVVSDNHGDRQCLVELVEKYRGTVDKMFHCGDSELEPTDELWNELIVVTGNCDYDERYVTEQLIKTEEDQVLMTHGHLISVRQSTAALQARAEELGATIALYGHTHQLSVEFNAGLLIVNPGSIRLPRGQYLIKTYALIESTPTAFKVQYYDDQHREVPGLNFTFTK